MSEKLKNNIAEDSFMVRMSDFGKKILHSIDMDNKGEYIGKNGNFTISIGSECMSVSYSIDLNKSPKVIEMFFKRNPNSLDGTVQEIEIEEDITNYGIRPFLKCTCGRNARVLYMPADNHFFKCRVCQRITYESQRLNKHTMNGMFYHTNRMIKLFQEREKIGRMFYGGKLSKKARKLLNKYNKWSMQINMITRNKAEERLVSIINGQEKGIMEELSLFV